MADREHARLTHRLTTLRDMIDAQRARLDALTTHIDVLWTCVLILLGLILWHLLAGHG